MNQVSVVIIGQNEDQIIGKSIASVIDALKHIKAKEIIYVDSASTDQSIEIAKKYPINILQLKPDWVHTPAAGRYIGYLNTLGEYIFFLDGDSTMDIDWPEKAVRYLDDHPRVAGVAGLIDEIYWNRHHDEIGKKINKYKQIHDVESVILLAGPAMYRRAVLNEVGPFHPFIFCDEERELGLRLRRAGWEMERLLIPMAVKYGPPRESFAEISSKLSRNLYSQGLTWRYCARNGFFWQYARERLGFVFKFTAAMVMTLFVLVISIVLKTDILIGGWAALGLLVLLYLIYRKKSLASVIVSLAKEFIISYKTLRTFITTKVRPMDDYPTDVIVVETSQAQAKSQVIASSA